MNFNKILQKYRSLAFSERDKGDRFERLIQSYLYTDPKYTHFTKIWLWREFPYRLDFGGHDIGIDLVAETAEGEYWAIQCKCYSEDARINKEEVDTFLSTSGRSFKDNRNKECNFSRRLWISTTNNWSSNATETLQNQNPPVTRINLTDLIEAPVQWDKIDEGIFGEKARTVKKQIKFHQKEALTRTLDYFKKENRGKLIMACGTGKTFTSLKIAEELTNHSGTILFLVPSIALLGQTLREWSSDAQEEINIIAICSDSEITKDRKSNEDTGIASTVDLAVPASTNVNNILKQLEYFEMTNKKGMTVVFSTYQSIDVVAAAQKRLESIGSKYQKFDLIICDEAHRTTGVTLSGEDESSFVKVHDNTFINAKKRLYMTATPRLYAEDSKRKAAESSALVCSMDDEALYGKDIYRIGFGMAVEQGLLSDYKVLILTLSENDVTPEVQKVLQNSEHEIGIDDASKLIGCINAMSKQILGEKGTLNANDPEPMRRAVAFTPSIKISRKITASFNDIRDTYHDSVPELKKETLVNLHSRHIDGSMSATDRDELMSWLKAEPENANDARVLTNVRCLSEGVDVPSLDAVMFLSAKNSQVDVVQSVGRVMRKSPGKQYGYIIIPIVVPADIKPEDALNDNERYKVVWTVLNALRAHDDRFNAIVNKIDLNKNLPEQILVGRPDPDGDGDPFNDPESTRQGLQRTSQMAMHFNELQNAIYAKMVLKVGDRQYWEDWAKSVADIAERQVKRITKIVDEDDNAHMAFREFTRGLRKNINPSVTEQQAIEMLSQHIITKPVFEALFEGYSFVQNNAVSIAMQKALDAIESKSIEGEDIALLEGFYKSVRRRAAGIDNAEGKQRIIVELYDKFFKSAFPKMVEQLGIVYTPVEVVDFIIYSVNDVLKKEFGRSLSDEGVSILDPFTGTGTFITRLLQSGLIRPEDLERKYKHEIFANEIVLLAYYIAAVNIENAYHDLLKMDEYESFEGIVLTDTFQLSENDDNTTLFSEALIENSQRLQRQKDTSLKIIIGNPPYSAGQKSVNDNAQNLKYENLEKRIANTYALAGNNTNKNSLYNSYIKAFRWSSDRLSKDGGIISFISIGSWIDANAQEGFRKSLEKEFDSIYIFNLRGNANTNGELRRRESGNVFGEGSKTPVAITLLVKNPKLKKEHATIYYYDIGDYLTKDQKLKILTEFGSVLNPGISWLQLVPNKYGDWIKHRSDTFKVYPPLGQRSEQALTYFTSFSGGLQTNRDPWIYNFSKLQLKTNIENMINFYNSQIKELRKYCEEKSIDPNNVIHKLIDNDPKKIKWTRGLKISLAKYKVGDIKSGKIRDGLYRPFSKQKVYLSRQFNEYVNKMDMFFPQENSKNRVICVSSTGTTNEFTTLMVNVIPNVEFVSRCQVFPLYIYEKIDITRNSLFEHNNNEEYNCRDGISNHIYSQAQNQYGKNITKEDIFYYIYGFLHSPDYRKSFANDLKKMLPHIPLIKIVDDFWSFNKAGRRLAELHINYEEINPYEGVKVSGTQYNNYHIEKMRFISKTDKSTIIYNNQITIENIPNEAYEYVVNGKSAIEWIIDRYQIKKDKDSGLINDPNDWAKEVGNPRYVLDLLLSVINVSMQTVDIVNNLPKLTFESSNDN